MTIYYNRKNNCVPCSLDNTTGSNTNTNGNSTTEPSKINCSPCSANIINIAKVGDKVKVFFDNGTFLTVEPDIIDNSIYELSNNKLSELEDRLNKLESSLVIVNDL